MATYLVTGAAGFIASRVSEQLLDRGDRVVGVDDLNDAYDVRLKEWRLARLRSRAGFEFAQQDIADRAACRGLFERGVAYDAVINLAARAGVRQSVENPWIYNRTNADGTLNLLQECVARGVKKFVLASTSSLYGGDHPQPYSETLSTERPLSPYAASKKAAEVMCYTYHYLYGIDVTILRYFTVYGPAGRPDMSLFRFVQWISEGRPVTVFGDGQQSRDFTFVDDVARGTIAGQRPLGYEIINLGSDEPVVLADAIALVEQLLGRSAVLQHVPRHPADVLATWADIRKANRLLDWRPQYEFRRGVAELVDWYREHRGWAKEIRTG
ncbi:MAG: NAD-dependent epimerase/dehydratase family protein [Gemmatimonadetes bacterium]|nr:NAD-dependent epimerase/dehydratase family protein [Gemmatimonadota bacterium]